MSKEVNRKSNKPILPKTGMRYSDVNQIIEDAFASFGIKANHVDNYQPQDNVIKVTFFKKKK
ncbi:MAG: hypothetical protein AB7O73_07310 [Bacteroidia bacterium]